MLTVEGIESIGITSIWVLEPLLAKLLLELKRRGYAVASVKPRSFGGYNITYIEPDVVAIKGSVYIYYNQPRRGLTVEGSNVDDLLAVFNEVEGILKTIGSDPDKGVLLYEMLVKANAVGGRWALKEIIKTEDLLGLDLLAIPISFVSARGDPNSGQWFGLDIRPLWTSWTDEKVYYEIVMTYRDSKERILKMLKRIDSDINIILERISNTLTLYRIG